MFRRLGPIISAAILCSGIAALVLRENRLAAEVSDGRTTVRLLAQGLLAGEGSFREFQPTSMLAPPRYEERFTQGCGQIDAPPLLGYGSVRSGTCSLYLNNLKRTALRTSACAVPILIAFVSPADCPLCMQESVQWDRLSRMARGAGLALIAVAAGVRDEERKQFTSALGIDAPVFFDAAGAVARACAVRETPTTMLFSASGELLLANRSGMAKRDQDAFRKSVISALNR